MKRHRIASPLRLITFITIIIVLAVMAGGSYFGYFDAAGRSEEAWVPYQVQPGDTLWQLALIHGRQDEDVRQTVYRIGKQNGIQANSLIAGVTIQLPAPRD